MLHLRRRAPSLPFLDRSHLDAAEPEVKPVFTIEADVEAGLYDVDLGVFKIIRPPTVDQSPDDIEVESRIVPPEPPLPLCSGCFTRVDEDGHCGC